MGALAALYASGGLDRPQFVEAFVLVVHAAKIRAARLAEVWLWRWSLANWPEPIEPLGLIPDPEVAAVLRAAVETITEPVGEVGQDNVDEFQARTVEEISRGAVSFRSGVEIVNRAERVGKDAALESGRETAQQRMRRHGIESWVWVAQPEACDECARHHGNVYPIEVTFRDHPQCSCLLYTPCGQTSPSNMCSSLVS